MPIYLLFLSAALGCGRRDSGTNGTQRHSSASTSASLQAVDSGAVARTALQYALGITALTGFEEIIPGGKSLPTLYSETYATSSDDQKVFQVSLGQKRTAGVEKICEFTVDGVPPGPKVTQTFIVTVEIDAMKMMRVKTRIQSTGAIREFGPFLLE